MKTVQKLAEDGRIIEDINDGDEIQPDAGNTSLLLTADYQSNILKPLFVKAQHTLSATDPGRTQAAMKDTSAPLPLAGDLFLIQKIIEKNIWPHTVTDEITREEFYREKRQRTLSETFEQKQMACVEVSLFSLRVLQDRGHPARLISGGLVKHEPDARGYAQASAHTFIAIDDGQSPAVTIYDPSQPVATTGGHYPSIMSVDRTYYERWLTAGQSGISLMTTREDFTGRAKYYGAAPSVELALNRYILPQAEAPAAQKKGAELPAPVVAPV